MASIFLVLKWLGCPVFKSHSKTWPLFDHLNTRLVLPKTFVVIKTIWANKSYLPSRQIELSIKSQNAFINSVLIGSFCNFVPKFLVRNEGKLFKEPVWINVSWYTQFSLYQADIILNRFWENWKIVPVRIIVVSD